MLIETYATIFGLLIGSFLNVCIYRVPRKLSIVTPVQSFCPNCKRGITPFENIPVLSWLVLRGKCHGCKEGISWQYPFVELLSGLACYASYVRFGLTPTGFVIFALCAALIVITFIDLEFKIIPNVISFPGMTIGLVLGMISEYTNAFSEPVTQGALDSLVGFFIGGGFFYAIGMTYYLITKKVGLGGGDIKLMGMTGAILGWKSIPTTIFAGSFVGAIVGIAFMLMKKTGRQTEIPFGPWLALGALIYIFSDIRFFQYF